MAAAKKPAAKKAPAKKVATKKKKQSELNQTIQKTPQAYPVCGVFICVSPGESRVLYFKAG